MTDAFGFWRVRSEERNRRPEGAYIGKHVDAETLERSGAEWLLKQMKSTSVSE